MLYVMYGILCVHIRDPILDGEVNEMNGKIRTFTLLTACDLHVQVHVFIVSWTQI